MPNSVDQVRPPEYFEMQPRGGDDHAITQPRGTPPPVTQDDLRTPLNLPEMAFYLAGFGGAAFVGCTFTAIAALLPSRQFANDLPPSSIVFAQISMGALAAAAFIAAMIPLGTFCGELRNEGLPQLRRYLANERQPQADPYYTRDWERFEDPQAPATS